MKVGGEGRYGFTLIPRSGAGLAGHPPVPGDSPQTWVEVDLTPPAVQIHGELIGVSGRRVVQVKWQARDRNLAPDPVTILCAEKPDGPWKELSRELAPTGSREFEAEELPRAFYLRVEATDRAGNVGAYTTPDRVEADLTIPIIRKVTVKPTPAR